MDFSANMNKSMGNSRDIKEVKEKKKEICDLMGASEICAVLEWITDVSLHSFLLSNFLHLCASSDLIYKHLTDTDNCELSFFFFFWECLHFGWKGDNLQNKQHQSFQFQLLSDEQSDKETQHSTVGWVGEKSWYRLYAAWLILLMNVWLDP